MEFFAFCIAAIVLVSSYGLLGLAYARLISSCLYVAACIVVTRISSDIRIWEIGLAFWRPVVGVLLMSAVVYSVPAWVRQCK